MKEEYKELLEKLNALKELEEIREVIKESFCADVDLSIVTKHLNVFDIDIIDKKSKVKCKKETVFEVIDAAMERLKREIEELRNEKC